MTLFEVEAPEPSPHRVRALAGVIAGFAWPEQKGKTFEKLPQRQQEEALSAARDALMRLAQTPGGT